MTYIFIDTNILLHFIDFNQIKWADLVSDADFKLVITGTVISELDKKKRENSRVGQTAKRVLKRIKNDTELKDSIIKLRLTNPAQKYFDENGFDYRELDDQILASMKSFSEDNPTIEVRICTEDTGMILKSREMNIHLLELDETLYALKNELTAEQKEIKKIREENENLKNQRPVLQITFLNKKEFIALKVDKSIDLNPITYWSRRREDIKLQYPYLKMQKPAEGNSVMAILAAMNEIHPIQIDSYNKSLDDFYLKYENLSGVLIGEWRRDLFSINLSFLLSSIGNIPVRKIDLLLMFPNGFKVLDKNEIQRIELPRPPDKPIKGSLMGSPLFRMDFNSADADKKVKSSITSIASCEHEEKGLFECVYLKLGDIKHFMHQINSDIVVEFYNFMEMKNFSILYEVTAENIPHKLEGKLNVTFEDKS